MASLGNLVVHIGANTSGFMRGMNSIQNAMTSSKLKKGGPALTGSGVFGRGGINGGLTRSIVQANLLTSALQAGFGWLSGMAKEAIALSGSTEQTRLTFEVLTGDKDIGIALFSEMEKIAKSTTLTLQDTTSAAKQLLVSFDATQIPHLVTMLGNISSGMDNVSLQEMAFLLQTSATEAKLLARDLRQFTTRGIDLPGALKKVLGLQGPGSSEKLNQMVSAGQITMEKTLAALELLSNTTYQDMLKRQGETLVGRFTQYKDAISFALRDIGDMLVEAFDMKTMLENATTRIRNLQEQLWKMKPYVMQVGEAFWAMVGAIKEVGQVSAWAFGEMWTQLTAVGGLLHHVLGEGMNQAWSFGEVFTVVLATITWAFKNWGDVAYLALLGMNLGMHRFAGEMAHFFGVQLPAYWQYFSDNSGAIWDNIAEYALTVMINLGENIRSLWSAIWKVIASGGKEAFNWVRKDLLEGLNATVLPDMQDIPGRVMSQAEQDLQAQVDALKAIMGTSYEDAVAEALLKLYENKKPATPPGLGPQKPFAFDGAGAGDGSKGKTGSLNRTQEAWDKIMGNTNPVVEAIGKQTKEQREHAREQMRLFRQWQAGRFNVLMAFP